MLFTGRNKPPIKQTNKDPSVKQSTVVNQNTMSFSVKPNSVTNTYVPPERTVSKSRFTQPENMQMMENSSENVRRITSSKHNIAMENAFQITVRDELQKKISEIENSHQDTIRKLENKIEIVTRENQQNLLKNKQLEQKISENS